MNNKSILFCLFVFFKCSLCYSQTQVDTVWYDSQWQVTNRDDAAFFRAGIAIENGIYRVKDRYRNGVVQMDGTFLSLSPDVRSGNFNYYDTRGRLSAAEAWVNNVMDGTSIYYDTASGKPIAKRMYRAGKLDGIFSVYNTHTGKPLKEETYMHDKLEGVSIYYDSISGSMTRKMTYQNGRLNGAFTSYFPENGKVESVIMYVNDTIQGGLQSYDSDGVLRRDAVFTDGPLGTEMVYDSVARMIAKGMVDRDGIRQGIWQTFDPITGNISREAFMVNDTPQGKCTYYEPTCHSILFTGNMDGGHKNGEWKFYKSCDSRLQKLFTFRNGVQDGKYIIYDLSSGMVLREGQDSAGAESGRWTYYFPGTKKIHMIRNYDHGKFDGPLITYYSNGIVRRRDEYSKGICTVRRCYSSTGADTNYYGRIVAASYPQDYQNIFAHNIQYPELAARQHLEGKVVVKIFISEAGVVDNASVVASTNVLFNREAIRLAKGLHVGHPQMEDGEPIETTITLPIVFALKGQ